MNLRNRKKTVNSQEDKQTSDGKTESQDLSSHS